MRGGRYENLLTLRTSSASRADIGGEAIERGQQMTNWTVDVRGAAICAGVQLHFCPDGLAAHDPVPLFAMGDALAFVFPNNDRRSGTVFSADEDEGVIEVGGVRL